MRWLSRRGCVEERRALSSHIDECLGELVRIQTGPVPAILIGGCADVYKQIMSIDESGTSKIEKYGHWVSRGRYCRIILDGTTQQWNHVF